MFDAEIAATLLNRWNHRSPARGRDLYLELLREGNLHFTHQFGYVRTDDPPAPDACNIESLIFVDGSRALRICAPDLAPGWTRWTSLEPPLEFPPVCF